MSPIAAEPDSHGSYYPEATCDGEAIIGPTVWREKEITNEELVWPFSFEVRETGATGVGAFHRVIVSLFGGHDCVV